MSPPFWIFMAALAAICVWALLNRSLLSHRIAGHAKAEEALNTRMLVFRERVRNRNARILAEATADGGQKEKPVEDLLAPLLKGLYATDDHFERSLSEWQLATRFAPVMRSHFPSMHRVPFGKDFDVEYFAQKIGITPQQFRELMAKRASGPDIVHRKEKAHKSR